MTNFGSGVSGKNARVMSMNSLITTRTGTLPSRSSAPSRSKNRSQCRIDAIDRPSLDKRGVGDLVDRGLFVDGPGQDQVKVLAIKGRELVPFHRVGIKE